MADAILLLRLSIFLSLCALLNAEDTINLVRGVDIKNQGFYNPSQDFTCLDGSKTIPFSGVNDDYCDCVDASDEPGTAACPEGRFFCQNIGHKSTYLQSSRVNDGLCDCCDGSDEYDSQVACFNECDKHGREEQIRLQLEKEEQNAGVEIRRNYIQQGADKKNEKKVRVETLNKLLEERRVKLEELKAAKETAEGPEKDAKDKHEKAWEEVQKVQKEEREKQEKADVFRLLDLDKNGWVQFAELMAHPNLNADMSENEAKDILGGEALVDSEGFSGIWETIKPRFLKDGRPVPASKTPPVEESGGETEEGDTSEEKPPEEEIKAEETENMPDYDEYTRQLIEVAEQTRKGYDEAEREVRELESEQTTINEYFKINFGPEEEFSALKGECFEFTDREYTYKLCPFERVTQRQKSGGSETDLGNWGKWEVEGDYTKMKYDGGQSCWNGPARSTLVKMSCGRENVVSSVVEPSRCEYEMEFKTPALCVGGGHPVHNEL